MEIGIRTVRINTRNWTDTQVELMMVLCALLLASRACLGAAWEGGVHKAWAPLQEALDQWEYTNDFALVVGNRSGVQFKHERGGACVPPWMRICLSDAHVRALIIAAPTHALRDIRVGVSGRGVGWRDATMRGRGGRPGREGGKRTAQPTRPSVHL